MSEFRLQSFKFGLDSRRSELTSQPGTLYKLDNAHVNQGAEIEKRKAFARYFDATKLDPTKVFGLQPTSQGLVVFGSVTAASLGLSAWPTYATVIVGCPQVSYMQLVHPDGSTAMSSVLSSDTYSDIPFVSAQFADGNVYQYYNGSLVTDFIAGQVTTAMETAGIVDYSKLRDHLINLVNSTSGYTATTDGVSVSGLEITSVDTSPFSIFSTINPNAGEILDALPNSSGVDPVPAVGAVGSFSIIAAKPSSAIISSVKYNTTELLSASVGGGTGDVNDLATRVAIQINKSHSSTGFSAFATGNTVTISAPTSATATLTVTASDVCIGDYAATVTGTAFSVTDLQINGSTVLTTKEYAFPVLTATITGITWSANVMTITTTAAHNIVAGAVITVTGTNATYNGTWTVQSVTTSSPFHILITRTGSGTTYSGSGTVTLTTSYSTIAALVAAIALDVNTNFSTYVAIANGTDSNIRLSKAISSSTDSNLSVSWTFGFGNGATSGTGSSGLAANISASQLLISWYNVGYHAWSFSTPPVTCVASGGSPPYKFNWTLVSYITTNGTKPTITQANAASTKFLFGSFGGGNEPSSGTPGTITGTFKCTVTDSANATTSVNVVVSN